MPWLMIRDEKPLRHLLDKGFVYILRPHIKKSGVCQLKDGNYRTIGKVLVIYIGIIIDYEIVKTIGNRLIPLTNYLQHSGFNSINEWLKTCRYGSMLRLYYVELLEYYE